MPGIRVLQQLERAVRVNGSWRKEWNPEEMPRSGTRPKKAEGIISTKGFFSVKAAISSPLPLSCLHYQSRGQTNIKLAPATWKETCFLWKGLEGVSIPWYGTFPVVGELVQLLNDPGDYNPFEGNFRGEERRCVRREQEKSGTVYQNVTSVANAVPRAAGAVALAGRTNMWASSRAC